MFVCIGLVDDAETGVRDEHLWDADALWGLIVLEKGCDDTRQGER